MFPGTALWYNQYRNNNKKKNHLVVLWFLHENTILEIIKESVQKYYKISDKRQCFIKKNTSKIRKDREKEKK